MRSTRRLLALAAVLAAVGAAPVTDAEGRAGVRHDAPAYADRLTAHAHGRFGPREPAGRVAYGTAPGRHADGDGPGETGKGGAGETGKAGPGEAGETGDGRPGGGRTSGPDRTDPFVVVASAAAGAGALVALFLSVSRALRRRQG
ncbi:hypothetical protein AB0912_13885 [Streptomyces sp. NPDC007084]|uniref:hypothetical protein n=1 Tax=Streptomyces sp. NPDC007084 TaxID=3154313 RepID=UPI00345667BB